MRGNDFMRLKNRLAKTINPSKKRGAVILQKEDDKL